MGSDSAVTSTGDPTADWRPMAFGDRLARDIDDPFYEPLWAGRRVIVEISAGEVSTRETELGNHPGAIDLRAALAAASLADELVLDGYLLPAPLPGTGDVPVPPVQPGAAAGITAGAMLRQMLLGGLGRGNGGRTIAPVLQPVAVSLDGPLAFVAVDLLWLDGQALIDVPLGERKRLLESALADGTLVRRTPSVRPPIERWSGHWLTLGFQEMAVKAANSRYVPGGISEAWTIVPIPRR